MKSTYLNRLFAIISVSLVFAGCTSSQKSGNGNIDEDTAYISAEADETDLDSNEVSSQVKDFCDIADRCAEKIANATSSEMIDKIAEECDDLTSVSDNNQTELTDGDRELLKKSISNFYVVTTCKIYDLDGKKYDRQNIIADVNSEVDMVLFKSHYLSDVRENIGDMFK